VFIAFIALVERTSYVVAFSLRWVIVVLTALVPLVVVVIVVVEHAALEVDLGSCTCTAPTPILAAQGGTQVAYSYLSRLFFVILQLFFVILHSFLLFYENFCHFTFFILQFCLVLCSYYIFYFGVIFFCYFMGLFCSFIDNLLYVILLITFAIYEYLFDILWIYNMFLFNE
jgi:hypothetical protein